MDRDFVALLKASNGHFLYESGHHGTLWLDLDDLLTKPAELTPFIVELARRIGARDIDAICGPLTGGAFVAFSVATLLELPFCFAERTAVPVTEGQPSATYALPDAFHNQVRGKRVAVIDDVVNAGSATRGAIAALAADGATTTAIGALLVLGDAVPRYAAAHGIAIESLAALPIDLWQPTDCPLCADGVPLVSHFGRQ